jgi:hypothetical protein
MSQFKTVAYRALVAMALCLAFSLASAISSDLATADEVRDDRPTEATKVLEKDWLFQADGTPTTSRIHGEIRWTRDIATRLTERTDGLDLSSELKELDALQRRLPGNDPTQVKPEATPSESLPKGLVARWAFDHIENHQTLDTSQDDTQAGLHGTIHGQSEVTQGVGGDALKLTGQAYVETSPQATALARRNYTIAAWIRTTAGVVDVLGSGVGRGVGRHAGGRGAGEQRRHRGER